MIQIPKEIVRKLQPGNSKYLTEKQRQTIVKILQGMTVSFSPWPNMPEPGDTTREIPEPLELNRGGSTISRDSLAVARMVKEFSDVASELGFGAEVNNILDSLGLGKENAERNIGQAPRPSGSGSQFKNLGGIDLPENRRPGLQIPVLTPSKAAKGSSAQGVLGEAGSGTVFGPGTRRTFPAHPGSHGSGVEVTAPDGRTSSIGIEYTPGFGFTAVFTGVDRTGTRRHERLFVSANGNGTASTITTTTADGKETTEVTGDDAAIVEEKRLLQEQARRVEAERPASEARDGASKTIDPDSAGGSAIGYWNPWTGQYWGPHKRLDAKEVNPGRDPSSTRVLGGNAPIIDPKKLFTDPNPDALRGKPDPKLRSAADGGPKTPGVNPPEPQSKP